MTAPLNAQEALDRIYARVYDHGGDGASLATEWKGHHVHIGLDKDVTLVPASRRFKVAFDRRGYRWTVEVAVPTPSAEILPAHVEAVFDALRDALGPAEGFTKAVGEPGTRPAATGSRT